MIKNKFKIAINVSPLSDGNSVRGVGYYTKHLVKSLNHEIKTNPDFSHYQITLLSSASNSHFDLIHYPFFDPFFLTLPIPNQTPFIVTVHDLIPRVFRSHFPVGLRGEIKWQIQKHRLRHASYIICPSHTAKYSISQVLKFPSSRIFTTYEAADPSFRPIKNQSLLKKIKNKYNLPDKFVLYVGDINWNKNIPSLAQACIDLKIPLVLVGQAATTPAISHPWTKDQQYIQSLCSPYILKTGFVPDSDLPYIFNLATLYCQPSFSEGFGLPLLQAMQTGLPTIYSSHTSLAEISDYSGLFFNPHSQSDLKQKIKKLWSNSLLQSKLKKLSLSRATHFSWSNTALQTLAVYRLIELRDQR